MRMLVQNPLARNVAVETEAESRNAATQKQLDALVAAVKSLPDGAQVLMKAAEAADQPDEPDAGMETPARDGDGNAGGEEAAPSGTESTGRAPPAPEHADGLDGHAAPTETPPSEERPAHLRITTATKARLIPGLQQLLRNASRAAHTMVATPSRQETHGDMPAPDPEDRRHRSPRPANAIDVPALQHTRFPVVCLSRPHNRHLKAPTQSATAVQKRPYVDESDEGEVERGDQPVRHPHRLRWRWPGRLKELRHGG